MICFYLAPLQALPHRHPTIREKKLVTTFGEHKHIGDGAHLQQLAGTFK